MKVCSVERERRKYSFYFRDDQKKRGDWGGAKTLPKPKEKRLHSIRVCD